MSWHVVVVTKSRARRCMVLLLRLALSSFAALAARLLSGARLGMALELAESMQRSPGRLLVLKEISLAAALLAITSSELSAKSASLEPKQGHCFSRLRSDFDVELVEY